MNERRHEYSNLIRKRKKSQLLQLKRKCTSTANTPATFTTGGSSLKNVAVQYIQQPNVSSLQALETALATTNATILELDTPTQMMELCNTLAQSLQAHASFAVQVDASYMTQDAPLLQVCQQMLWAVGNVAGDSQVARDALRKAGVVPSLCTVLKRGMELKHTCICRNAAWALSNLTRGVTTSGWEFCGDSLLTPVLLASVLSSPEQQVSATVKSTWWQTVANEACWILAFLTAREDQVVDYLIQPSNELLWLLPNKQFVVVAALAHRLDEASKAVVSNSTRELTETQLQALRMTIPCLRSIGNIATASQGRHVDILLQESSIVTSLVTLIQAGYMTTNGDVQAVAVEATWAAGSLLCDAGIDSHVSTTIAAPTLLPILHQAILHGKSDLKREAVSAVWNAVAAPPNSQNDGSASLATRDGFLSSTAQVPGMVLCLVNMLTSMDADAVFYSIQLLNAMLRRLQVKREFVEANGVDALEAVCDRASQSNAYGGGQDWNGMSDDSADIAADLIDDLFSNDADMNQDDDDDNNGGMTMAMPASFTFSPISVDAQHHHFDFGGKVRSRKANTVIDESEIVTIQNAVSSPSSESIPLPTTASHRDYSSSNEQNHGTSYLFFIERAKSFMKRQMSVYLTSVSTSSEDAMQKMGLMRSSIVYGRTVGDGNVLRAWKEGGIGVTVKLPSGGSESGLRNPLYSPTMSGYFQNTWLNKIAFWSRGIISLLETAKGMQIEDSNQFMGGVIGNAKTNQDTKADVSEPAEYMLHCWDDS